MEYPFSGILVRYATRIASSSEGDSQTGAPESAPLVQDQLHVNLWEVSSPSVLDIGVMIGDWADTDAVIVDLPWQINAESIQDLGSRLNSEKTIAAIFNEVVSYDSCADLNFARVSFRPGDVVDLSGSASRNTGHFSLLRLSAKSYELTQVAAGNGQFSSQLRISLPPLAQLQAAQSQNAGPHPLYVRFRISDVPPEVYSSVFRQADRNLLSSSSETRIIDFRVNVRRGIPEEILSGDYSLRFPRFKKIHLFLTIHRTQICDFESQNFVGCRSLVDEAIWHDYLYGSNSPAPVEELRNYLGYQWTASGSESGATGRSPAGAKDLVVLGRFSTNISSAWRLVRFVLFALVFGMIGSGLWDIFKPLTDGAYLEHLWSERWLIAGLLALIAICLCAVRPWRDQDMNWLKRRKLRP